MCIIYYIFACELKVPIILHTVCAVTHDTGRCSTMNKCGMCAIFRQCSLHYGSCLLQFGVVYCQALPIQTSFEISSSCLYTDVSFYLIVTPFSWNVGLAMAPPWGAMHRYFLN